MSASQPVPNPPASWFHSGPMESVVSDISQRTVWRNTSPDQFYLPVDVNVAAVRRLAHQPEEDLQEHPVRPRR